MGKNSRRTEAELKEELREQILDIRSAASRFDQGDTWEAKRLATSVYVLLSDGTGRTRSLLGQMGLKKGMKLLTSNVNKEVIREDGTRLSPQIGTPMIRPSISFEGGKVVSSVYTPALGQGGAVGNHAWVGFSNWWEERIFSESCHLRLTRKNIVFSIRSQDAGAHFDERVRNSQYRAFSLGKGPMTGLFEKTDSSGSSQIIQTKGGVRALMRQIAWEVDESLRILGY